MKIKFHRNVVVLIWLTGYRIGTNAEFNKIRRQGTHSVLHRETQAVNPPSSRLLKKCMGRALGRLNLPLRRMDSQRFLEILT